MPAPTTKDAVLLAVTNAEEPYTISGLRDALGKSDAAVRKAVKQLIDDDVVVKDEETNTIVLKPKAGRRVGQRDDEVIARDDKVLAAVKDAGTEGVVKNVLVQSTGMSPNEVYLSLYRLRKAEKVRREGNGTRGARWVAA